MKPFYCRECSNLSYIKKENKSPPGVSVIKQISCQFFEQQESDLPLTSPTPNTFKYHEEALTYGMCFSSFKQLKIFDWNILIKELTVVCMKLCLYISRMIKLAL